MGSIHTYMGKNENKLIDTTSVDHGGVYGGGVPLIHDADILSCRVGDNSSFRGKLMACRWMFKILRPNCGLIFGLFRDETTCENTHPRVEKSQPPPTPHLISIVMVCPNPPLNATRIIFVYDDSCIVECTHTNLTDSV